VEDITNLGFQAGLRSRTNPRESGKSLDRPAFDEAYARLAEAGYDLVPGDRAWAAFEAARASYAGRLEAMANYWATPTNSWLRSEAPLASPVHTPSDVAEG
jgi:hypothetical protein